MVAGTAIDTSYTRSYSRIVVPSETVVQIEIEAHPGIEAQPVQYSFAPQSSLDMHLPFSLLEVGRPYNIFHHGL